MKKINIKVIMTVLALSFTLLLPVTAKAGVVNTVNTSSDTTGKITANGTVAPGVLAVAIMVYDSSNNLVAMETAAVDATNNYNYTLTTAVTTGAYTVKVADYNGGASVSSNVNVTVAGGGIGGGLGGAAVAAVPTPAKDSSSPKTGVDVNYLPLIALIGAASMLLVVNKKVA